MKIIKHVVLISFGLLLNFSCSHEDKVLDEVNKINLDLEILRFDSIFYASSPQNLSQLKNDYPFMFHNSIPDSIWVKKFEDTIQVEISSEVNKAFKEFAPIEQNLELFFKHLKYYYPEVDIPKVISLAEYVDYRAKVVLNNDLLFISLDNYLGEKHRFYSGFKDYVARLQKPEQILPDVANAYAKKIIPYPSSRNFLSQIIYEGKLLYFKQKTLPLCDEYELIGYTMEQYKWANEEEVMIWQYFIQKELLYNTDLDLRRRFIEMAPFTKFYLEIDNETPPRLGQYIGWQIVKAFADKNPQLSLKQIIQTNYQDIFDTSNYKP